MFGLGTLVFASPWVLAALALIPLAYFIIRAIPPAPRRVFFPATWLTRQLNSENTTSQSAPWWLLLLRLVMLGLLILALSGPSLTRSTDLNQSGPAIVIIDNDWSAAVDWETRRALAQERVKRYGEEGRQIAVVPTAAPIGGWQKNTAPTFLSSGEAAQRLVVLEPAPWAPDYKAIAQQVEQLAASGAQSAIYLTNGIDHGEAGSALSRMDAATPLTLIALKQAGLAQIAITNVKAVAGGFDVLLTRKEGEPAISVDVGISDSAGVLLAKESVRFAANVAKVDTSLQVSPQLRARVAQLSIDGARHAGAVYVFDARAQRPLAGLAASSASIIDQPLQTPNYYLSRALQPYASLERGDIDALLKLALSVLLLPDQARLPERDETAVLAWVEAGGTLIRFAGPNLFAGEDLRGDKLLPIRLRPEPRVVGGALAWAAAQPLAPFPADSPFAGITIAEEIRVESQALVRSGSAQQAKTWARLADGTPLVSAATQGSGSLIFFHTSANAAWSNLALSGTFVEMLQRLMQISLPGQRGGSGAGDQMSLVKLLAGNGQLVNAGDAIAPRPLEALRRHASAPTQPPGVYEGAQSAYALNLAAPAGPLTPRTQLRRLEQASGALPYQLVDGPQERSLSGPLLLAIFFLALVDIAATLALHSNPGLKLNVKALLRGAGAAACTGLTLILVAPGDAAAQDASKADLAANVRLACLRTFAADVDALCLNGLNSLSRQLNLRTSVWTGQAQSIDAASDDLGLYPMIYWPIGSKTQPLTPAAYTKLNGYLRNGGLLLIDFGIDVPGQARMDVTTPGGDMLAEIRRSLTIPPLANLTKEHVLTHSFYILKTYPGRRGPAAVWVETGGEAIGADVSPIIMGGADWLTAWASAQTNLPGYAGGQNRDIELAVRFGINAVMYALTGTYKADQVHLPALLDRVGREE